MADCKFTLSELKELMEKFADTGLGEFCLKEEGTELKMKAKSQTVVAVPAGENCVPAPAAAPEKAEKKPCDGQVVKAPLVGTFYASPAPDKPPYVTVGSRVKKGDTLFVIESMKLMNEVSSDFDGEVAEILVENAQGVEFNQPIMVVR